MSATHTLLLNVSVASAVLGVIGWSLVAAGYYVLASGRNKTLITVSNGANVHLDEVLGIVGLFLAFASAITFVATTIFAVIING